MNITSILKYHNYIVTCATILKDGRLATCTCSWGDLIIIYNNKTFRPDLISKEHKNFVVYLLLLSTGMLASCSYDNTIKILLLLFILLIIINIYKNIKSILKINVGVWFKLKKMRYPTI